MLPGVSGEQKDQSDWGGESQGRDEAVDEVREVGPCGLQEDLGFHSECDGSHRGDCNRGVM